MHNFLEVPIYYLRAGTLTAFAEHFYGGMLDSKKKEEVRGHVLFFGENPGG